MNAEEAAEQRRAALRALLRRPLLTARDDPETLVRVRRHQDDLRDWLRSEVGWRLHVDTEIARLFKIPPTLDDPTRPALDRHGRPFGRRRYVLLCLALSALVRADAQVTLGYLAERVLNLAADRRLDLEFALETRGERSDLVAVVRMLLDWDVLRRVAGDEEDYVAASGDVLYDIRRNVLSVLLSSVRGPSVVTAGTFEERLAALIDEPVPDTESLRNRALRHRLTRRLLEDPVVYHDDLDQAERAYLSSQRPALTRRIEEAAGLVPEVRAEGIAMVDPRDELTDVRMPEQRTEGHATLLVAEFLAESGVRSLAELRVFVREAARAHATYWRKGVTEPGAEDELLDIALRKLIALRLVVVRSDGVRPLPAIARYALAEPTVQESRKADR
ncbi:TIGR02678 family protein [Thermomonospora umbrina]|uniref:Uncharacterized protein (TIGR02678 family) n=1 Tax=Thermomonospora umbrina TaxID=111806 RepID=A0A3D9SNG1_9ACTN|nr:TIGR02678 family protein [Thermomonospora umbrina]REE95970.1 uncharacterized protein (TIGR02678 family) [Thermomonospora umbrina]